MDILILRNGTQLGPFSHEVAHEMVRDGSVQISDLAWSNGLPQWVPLANLLYRSDAPPPAPGSIPPPPPPASAPGRNDPASQPAGEPATARQRAFLSYMSIPFPADMTKEAASLLVNDAMENPKDPARLSAWNEERLTLHPDLFAAEIQARKENRAQHFLEICQTEGAEYFQKITKAHCQVLVGFLDLKHPHWDADERNAGPKYFFPAVAEKFPQLLTNIGRARFKVGGTPGPAPKSAAPPRKAPPANPILALVRGVFFGALILGVLWFVRNLMHKPANSSAAASASATVAPIVPTAAPVRPARTSAPAPGPVAALDPAPPAPTPPRETPVPTEDLTVAKTPGAGTASDPSASMSTEPAAPPAETPAAAAAGDPFAPSTPVGIPAAQNPPSVVTITRPVQIKLAYGNITVPVGQRVKFVLHSGDTVTVDYLSNRVTIPVSSTDFGRAPAPSPAAKPASAAARAAATPAAEPPAEATPEPLFGVPSSAPAPAAAEPEMDSSAQ